jgi:hypothetical protein
VLEELVPQAPGSGFDAEVLLRRVLGDIYGFAVKFQPMGSGQVGDELLVGVGCGTAQFVVEMNYGEHDAKFGAQFKQESKQANRIRSAGNSHADAVSGRDQFLTPNVVQDLVCQRMHQEHSIPT